MTDPVDPSTRLRVLSLDGWRCVAPIVDRATDLCAGRLTLDHVKDQPLVGAPIVKRTPERKHRYRAPSDERHLVTLCWHHHLDGWATAHRPALRDYLARKRD